MQQHGPVDERAGAFGLDLRAVLSSASPSAEAERRLGRRCRIVDSSHGIPLEPATWCLVTLAAAGPVLFASKRELPGVTLQRLLQRRWDAVQLNVRWPNLHMEDGPVPLADVRRFFTPGSMARDPPNIIDESIEKFGVAYDLPQTVAATNLMVSSSAAYAARPGEADPVPFRPDLVMSGRNSRARFHVDSGFAVYHELFEGTKLWALLNFEEGKRFGMPHRMPSRLAELAKYPSLVLCTLRAGEALYTPPGWWHFVVSEEPSLALSNNILTVGGWDVATGLCSNPSAAAAAHLDEESLRRLRATHALGARTAKVVPLRSAGGKRVARAYLRAVMGLR